MPRLPRIWQLILPSQTNNFHSFRLPATPTPPPVWRNFPWYRTKRRTPLRACVVWRHRRVAMLCRLVRSSFQRSLSDATVNVAILAVTGTENYILPGRIFVRSRACSPPYTFSADFPPNGDLEYRRCETTHTGGVALRKQQWGFNELFESVTGPYVRAADPCFALGWQPHSWHRYCITCDGSTLSCQPTLAHCRSVLFRSVLYIRCLDRLSFNR